MPVLGITADSLAPSLHPGTIPNLTGWWDASNAASLTVPAGNDVSQWNDLSGHGYHATWVNSSWPATRVPAAINGLTAMDSHPGALQTTMPSMPKPVTFAIIVRTAATTGTSLTGAAYGSPSVGHFDLDDYGTYWRLLASSQFLVGQTTTQWTANTPEVVVVTYGADDVWAFHRNGVASGTGVTGGAFTSTLFALGAKGAPNGYNYAGLIGEVFVYNRVLTGAERQAVEQYLKTKWGTP